MPKPALVHLGPQPRRIDLRQHTQHVVERFPDDLEPVQLAHGSDDVRGIRSLAPCCLQQLFLLEKLQHPVHEPILSTAAKEPSSKLGEHREVEARVLKLQAQRVLPVKPSAHGVGRLPVGEILGEPLWFTQTA